ncbi:MAG: DNA polymerase Y family protein [Chitinophagaceae bacterium]|nr:MAG: DNA polymerase Y family protein [Chitinophagaceae bacterium]
MHKRFVSIWFRHLRTDWFTRRNPALKNLPFVLSSAVRGKKIVSAGNHLAELQGIYTGIAVADARAIIPGLQVLDDVPGLSTKLLTGMAEWSIRFTPVAAIDEPDGLLLDVTGCAHLWGDEKQYLTDIYKRFKGFGYDVRLSVADTIGAAWAVARYGRGSVIVEHGEQMNAILSLPGAALRIEPFTTERLNKLGLHNIRSFIHMPRPSLRRRFGLQILQRIGQALGHEEEWITPIQPVEEFHERLPCMDPIISAKGIEIALHRLLDALCFRLKQEEKGLRTAVLKCYRVDGKIDRIEIGTNRPSSNTQHLFKLFENKTGSIEPALGIELFTLDAPRVEDLPVAQEKLWETTDTLNDSELSELLDRIEGKVGAHHIHRYIPAEHYWPERSFKLAPSLHEKLQTPWKADGLRPLQMLDKPQPIEVTAPVPDYPPMMFRYKGKLHKIIRADGPERIEQEWWLRDGLHRDYYSVEDEEGKRYWLFRSGHYDSAKSYQWFIHGFFA